MKSFRICFIALIAFWTASFGYSQQTIEDNNTSSFHKQSLISSLVEQHAEESPSGIVLYPFTMVEQNETPSAGLTRSVSMKINSSELSKIYSDQPSFMEMLIPSFDGKMIKLRLFKADIYADGFRIVTSQSNGQSVPVLLGAHYRGVLEDNNEAIVAFSFFKEEIFGMISLDNHNIAIVPDEKIKGQYLLYDDADITLGIPFSCEALETHPEDVGDENLGNGVAGAAKCVRVYIECDYALFQNKGSTAATVSWMTAVFNNVATLYQNETISTAVSEIFVWTDGDPYSRTDSYAALTKFRSLRPTFNGDIGHLAAFGGQNIGGIAWLDVLCTSYKYAYSNISSTYLNVPAYSWTIEVMTHEMGHNLGSNHTQWCGWVGGALDNCYTPEGGCARGPAPNNGGTIMSYCHLTQYGINFNNGFGTQPGDKIRSEVNGAGCLGSSCGGGGDCPSPTGLNASNITQTTATISWQAVTGATLYTLEYKLNTSSTWTVITTINTSYNLTGLLPATTYNARVKTTCGGTSSPYSNIINFTTANGGGGAYCASRGTNSSQEWIKRFKLVTIDRISGSDGGYYDGTALSTTLIKGSTNSVYFQAGRLSTPKPYYWRIWIDYNRNSSFADAGELIVSGFSSSINLLYSNFIVPSSASTGSTRLRISMKVGGYPTHCETFAFGEVEDYTVNIQSSGGLLGEGESLVTHNLEWLDISPNPFEDVTFIKFGSQSSQKVQINFTNMMGQIVKSEEIMSNPGENYFEMETGSLPKGHYIVNLISGDQIVQKKMIKM